MIGIAIKCYIAAGSLVGWYTGLEVQDYVGQSAGKQVEGYNYKDILFAFDGMRMRVNSNDCLYLEDPVKAYAKVLEYQERVQRTIAKAKKEIDKITTGNKPWCLVDEYGRRRCLYDTMERCLIKQDKLQYCEMKDVTFDVKED